jgi:hypothetical protein
MDTFQSADGNIHVTPNGEDHQESENCWCNPKWIEENKKEFLSGEANCKVLVHRTKKECEQ